MTLEDAIKIFARSKVDFKNDWYLWREINEKCVPDGIHLPEGNQYKKNISLKAQLYTKLKSITDHNEKKKLLRYYISTWGGIHGNSEKTLNSYTSSTNEELIALGSRGIASWSKALCITNPNSYAIFDARVSASLNALQIINETVSPRLYPVLSSRNNVIKEGIRLFKEKAKEKTWDAVPECDFYSTYLGHLKNAALSLDKNLEASVATIEMLLFAKAEELVREAFPNKFSKEGLNNKKPCFVAYSGDRDR